MGVVVSMKDMFTRNAQRIQASMMSLDATVAASTANMQRNMQRLQRGTMLMGAGLALLAVPTAVVASTIQTQKALGEMASLGVKDLASLSRAAEDFPACTAARQTGVLFRLADRARSKAEFKRLLALCRGRITAAFVKLQRPGTVHLLKGDMPLALAHVRRFLTIFYASEEWMLQTALEGHDWQALEFDPMTLATFHAESLLDFILEDVVFSLPGAKR